MGGYVCYQKDLTMINKLYFLVAMTLNLGVLLLYAPLAQAECSRNDVEYFLKKGFSREQVAAICEIAKPKQFGNPTEQDEEDYEAYDKELEARLRIEQRLQKEDDDILLLKTAIAGEDIRITPNWLDFKNPVCIAVGNSPNVENRVKVCPQVLHRVYFKGLRVKEYRRKYLLFGSREIEVEGTIKRKLLHDFKEYPVSVRTQLLNTYKANVKKGSTFIPVREDYPINRVQEILRSYARSAKG